MIAVVDYGIGNLFSVCNALKRIGHAARVIQPEELSLDAPFTVVLLPGVGAFGDGMRLLREKGWVPRLAEWKASGRPVLGLCLGAQLLGKGSDEDGGHEGLGWIQGRSRLIPSSDERGDRRVPHTQWNRIGSFESAWHSRLKGLPTCENEYFYFVHSYAFDPKSLPAEEAVAVTEFDGYRFASIVGAGKVIGIQFHPEKSGPAGLRLLSVCLEALQ